MSNAYLIGQITIKDPVKWQAYRDQVAESLKPWDAELVFRGKRFVLFSGEQPHTDTVVIRFPDTHSLEQWHNSAAYQALIPLRQEAADVTLTGYQAE